MGTQLQMINISLRTLQLPFVINRNIPWQKKEQILISLGIEVIIKIFILLATNKAGSLKSFDTGIINSFLQKNLDYDLKIQQTELAFRIWCAFSIVLQRNMRLQNTTDIKFSVYIHSEREAKHFLPFSSYQFYSSAYYNPTPIYLWEVFTECIKFYVTINDNYDPLHFTDTLYISYPLAKKR